MNEDPLQEALADESAFTGETDESELQALVSRLQTNILIIGSGGAGNKIKKSNIKNLVITDTIDNAAKVKNIKNIEVLTISNLVGEAIKRISNSTSVSDLFK